MALFKKPKPKLKAIDLEYLKPEELEYFCKTSVIDRIRCKNSKIEFNEDLAKNMEEKVRFYFIAKRNFEYYIINGILFEPWLEKHDIIEKEQSKRASICINDYIKDL